MIEYELDKPLNGEDLCEKIVRAFEEAAENETVEYSYVPFSLFKKKSEVKVKKKKYSLNLEKEIKYKAGDAGPKEVYKNLNIEFGTNDPQTDSSRVKIKFTIKGDEQVKKIEINCVGLFVNDSAGTSNWYEIESKSPNYKSYGMDTLVKETVNLLHRAIYGKLEDSTRGLDTAEKIL